MFARGSLYFHTLRHLHYQQISNRITRKLWRPRAPVGPTPSLASRLVFKGLGKKQSLFPPSRFQFLNVSHEVLRREDWNLAGRDPLWLFNLHYFDDLNAANGAEREGAHRTWIAKWIDENPKGEGFGWEPYTISLRAVNWIKWHWRSEGLSTEALASLAHQARHLEASLEVHLGGNHLWANAKALIFFGAFFSGPDAERWLKTGLDLLRKQIHVQILRDGGHYERSTMYQAILSEDLLELIELAQSGREGFSSDLAFWRKTAAEMLYWLGGMSHGDGEISFFNDAAIGIAQSPKALLEYAARLPLQLATLREGLTSFKESGYIRVAYSDKLLLADVGALGPDELLGHAHADSLSFEFSHGPQRILVNSGTSTYWDQSLRNLQRGTAAHNTVEIDGENSSEVWSRFRVARRAYTTILECVEKKQEVILQAAHTGYKRLSGHPIHGRTWIMNAHSLRILDHVTSGQAKAFFHFHPSVQAQTLAFKTSAPSLLKTTGYYPEFGKELSKQTLEVAFQESNLEFNLKY